MQQLQFVELDEGGRLVVSAEDGTRYAVPVDDRLRSSLRPRPHAPTPERPGAAVASPRDVQSMIRAGQTAEEVAQSTGWEIERVRRFEGPVLAEREHVVGLAQRAPVRAHGRTDGSHTLDRRVRERLQGRGVELTDLSWDAARHSAQGPWTVLVIFIAGGRERRAAWHYDVPTRGLEALDDEARWLSEDEQALPGGLAGHPLLGASHSEDEAAAELMATMRERRQRRGRRTTRKPAGPDDPAHVPGQQMMTDEVLPLEDLPYDPATMGDPPAAHPRGSVAESPAPVGEEQAAADAVEEAAEEAAEETATEPDAEADSEAGSKAARRAPRAARRERRRLRMPKLPAVEGGLQAEEKEAEPLPEGSYARTRPDPQEVSFDEFFGTDEEVGDEGPEDLVLDDVLDDDVVIEDAEPEVDEPEGEVEGELADDADAAVEPESDDEPVVDEPEADIESEADVESEVGEPVVDEPEPAPQKPSSRKGRTSVPSWDDIMFGSRDRG